MDPRPPEVDGPDRWPATAECADDDELAALALASDPNPELGPDAVPLTLFGVDATSLSSWYMPVVAIRRADGWRKPVVFGIVVALLALEALGLCSVFGQVVVG